MSVPRIGGFPSAGLGAFLGCDSELHQFHRRVSACFLVRGPQLSAEGQDRFRGGIRELLTFRGAEELFPASGVAGRPLADGAFGSAHVLGHGFPGGTAGTQFRGQGQEFIRWRFELRHEATYRKRGKRRKTTAAVATLAERYIQPPGCQTHEQAEEELQDEHRVILTQVPVTIQPIAMK